jgi:hypothetical protein
MRLYNVGFGLGFSIILAAFAACGGDDDNNSSSSSSSGSGGSSSSGTTSSTGVTTGTGSSTSSGDACPAVGYPGDGSADGVNTVTARVEDTSGNGVPNLLLDVCGFNLCLNGSTDANGDAAVNNTSGTVLDDARMYYGDGKDYVRLCQEIPGLPDATLGTINTVALPPLAQGQTIAAGSPVTQGPLTIEVDAAGAIEHDIILYATDAERVFRSVLIPHDNGSLSFPAIDASLNFDLVFGTAPINTKFCPAAKLTFDNTEGWAADAEVEVFFHGTEVFTDFAPYGGWAKVSDGKVSSDGTTVSTNDGEGIPQLGVFGVRLK